MADTVLTTFVGTGILEIHPDLIAYMLEFESIARHLAWGFLKWMNRNPWEEVQNCFHFMMRKCLDETGMVRMLMPTKSPILEPVSRVSSQSGGGKL